MADYKELFPPMLLELIDPLIDICGDVYLVGGAIRNFLSEQEINDFDFVVKEHSIKAAQFIADQFDGDFYILDHGRKTARALVCINKRQIKLDFAILMGETIDQDLFKRDFTINAMALSITDLNLIIDPAKGQEHLEHSLLCMCSPDSIRDDPVRTIRVIRFADEYNLQIDLSIETSMEKGVKQLGSISPERKRNALLDVVRVSTSKNVFLTMEKYGILKEILPNVQKLKGVSLTPPHAYDAYDHTLQVIHYCQLIIGELGVASKSSDSHPRISEAAAQLEGYKKLLNGFFSQSITTDRTKYQYLILAALFHDTGKAVVNHSIDEDRKRFPGHARVSAGLMRAWARKMNFSNKEVDFMGNVVRYHMKPSKILFTVPEKQKIAIHRFFKKTGDAGILVALLHLADVLTTYEDALTDARWSQAVDSVKNIFEAYFVNFEEIISPPILLNGNEILELLHLQQGKQIGHLIKILTEAQVTKEIKNRSEAITFLRKQLAAGLDMDEAA